MAGKCSEMDVSEVCEAKGATVHGLLIGELSPVKESRSTVGVRYFEGQFSDGQPPPSEVFTSPPFFLGS